MSHATAVLSITEERLYTARLGERTVTGLAVSSAWEGFTKYTDRNGSHLIVLDAEQRVITASPDLIAQLGAGTVEQPASADFTGAIGAPYGGGFFTGVIVVDGKRFALITSGAAGELRGKWAPTSDSIDSVSRRDGKSNTLEMEIAGSDLARQAAALTIGGHKDWYIPSRDELELMYRAFKPTEQRNYADGEDGVNPNSQPVGAAYSKDFPVQTTVENFRTGGADAFSAAWYWSSTQHASNPSYAWVQHFYDGNQTYGHKGNEGRARAVRRLPI